MTIKLSAQLRKPKEKLDSDFIPGVLYGKDIANQILKINKIYFDKIYKEAGESNLIDLDYGSGQSKVLIKDTQRDVVKGFFTHVDFYQVNMKEKITTEIPLNFIGEASAVKELGGVLIKDMDVVSIECLPQDLVDHLDVDISVLKTFNDAIRVQDIHLPAGLSLVQETNDMVIGVREPHVVEEETPSEEESSKEGEETSKEDEEKGENKGKEDKSSESEKK